jgi:hypothetical protein
MATLLLAGTAIFALAGAAWGAAAGIGLFFVLALNALRRSIR